MLFLQGSESSSTWDLYISKSKGDLECFRSSDGEGRSFCVGMEQPPDSWSAPIPKPHFSTKGKLLGLSNLQFSFLQNADDKLSWGLNERLCVKDLERHWTQSKNHDNLLFVAIRILIDH